MHNMYARRRLAEDVRQPAPGHEGDVPPDVAAVPLRS